MSTAYEDYLLAPEADLLAVLRAHPRPQFAGPAFVTEIADPSTSQRRQCYLGLRAAARALEAGDPIEALEDAMDAIKGGKRRSDRDKAILHAANALLHLPPATRSAADEATAGRRRLDDPASALQFDQHPRLVVATPSGRRWFIESHPATHPGGWADSWMSRRLAAHLALGEHLPNFAGVAILTARSPHLSVHAAPGVRHLLGGCDTCQEVQR